MKFSTSSVVLSLLVALSSAAPVASQAKRALTAQSYSQFQVSDGVAGNALAEVNAKFPKEDNSGREDEEKELPCVSPLPRYSTLRTPSITRNGMAWHETAEKLTSPSQYPPIDLTNLASVSAADLKILKTAAQVAEQAEVGTGGFNDELAANGNADDTALQNGKIKNKVLKLQLQVLALQVEAAQGDADQAKLDEETTKLNKNVQLDVAAKGQKSVGVTGTFAE